MCKIGTEAPLWEPGHGIGESHRFCGQRSITEGQIKFNFILERASQMSPWYDVKVYSK